MDWIVLGAGFIIAILISSVIVVDVVRRARERRLWTELRRPLSPYEQHRRRYELTGDEDELEAMRKAVREEDK